MLCIQHSLREGRLTKALFLAFVISDLSCYDYILYPSMSGGEASAVFPWQTADVNTDHTQKQV